MIKMVKYYALKNFGKATEFKIPLTFVGIKTTLSLSWNERVGALKIPRRPGFIYILLYSQKKQVKRIRVSNCLCNKNISSHVFLYVWRLLFGGYILIFELHSQILKTKISFLV